MGGNNCIFLIVKRRYTIGNNFTFKPIFVLVLLFNLKSLAFKQSNTILDTNNCNIIENNAKNRIIEYYDNNDFYALEQVLYYWESSCGMSEPLMRIKILLAIKEGSFNENLYFNLPILSYLTEYRDRAKRLNFVNEADITFLPLGLEQVTQYRDFTKSLAEELNENKNRTELERFFLDLYSDRFYRLLSRLGYDELSKTQLAQSYNNQKEQGIHSDDFNLYFGFLGGRWTPTGNLGILGNNNILGIDFGLKFKKIYLDLYVDLFISQTSQNINFLYEDGTTLLPSKNVEYETIFINIGYQLFENNKFEIISNQRFGWNRITFFEFLDPPIDETPRNRDFRTSAASLGLELRQYFGRSIYVSLDSRFNFNFIKNEGGTNLYGNSYQFGLKLGFIVREKE
jgi:hypothetical protein